MDLLFNDFWTVLPVKDTIDLFLPWRYLFSLFQIRRCFNILNPFSDQVYMFKSVKTLVDWKFSTMRSTCLSSYQLDSNFLYASFVITILFNVLTIEIIYALNTKSISSSCNGEELICLRTGSIIFTKNLLFNNDKSFW